MTLCGLHMIWRDMLTKEAITHAEQVPLLAGRGVRSSGVAKHTSNTCDDAEKLSLLAIEV